MNICTYNYKVIQSFCFFVSLKSCIISLTVSKVSGNKVLIQRRKFHNENLHSQVSIYGPLLFRIPSQKKWRMYRKLDAQSPLKVDLRLKDLNRSGWDFTNQVSVEH